jgi:hypothetical protein
MTRPSFRHCAGDVFWGPVALDAGTVSHLVGLYQEERRASSLHGDYAGSKIASDLLRELTEAKFEQAKWGRAAGWVS